MRSDGDCLIIISLFAQLTSPFNCVIIMHDNICSTINKSASFPETSPRHWRLIKHD